MRLITAHRILIAAGIAFFAFYAMLQARVFVTRGDTGAIVQAVVAAAVVVALALYYRTLKQWGRR